MASGYLAPGQEGQPDSPVSSTRDAHAGTGRVQRPGGPAPGGPGDRDRAVSLTAQRSPSPAVSLSTVNSAGAVMACRPRISASAVGLWWWLLWTVRVGAGLGP